MECDYTNKLSGGDFILNDLSFSNYEMTPDPFDCIVKSDTLANSLSPLENSSEKETKSHKVFQINKVKKPSQNLPLKERIEIKKYLAKKREESKRETFGHKPDHKFLELKRKKEIISMRNRISSQKSRDKKKRLFEDMKLEINLMKRELSIYRNRISLACHKCKELFIIPEGFQSNNLSGFFRIGLLTSMIVVICIIANCFSFNQYSENERNLLLKKEAPIKKEIPLILTLPDNKNYYSYKDIESHWTTNISNSFNSTNVMIPKDRSIMLSSRNNYSSDVKFTKQERKNQRKILNEQRELFLKKMNSKLKNENIRKSINDPKRNFLDLEQKTNYSTCLNDQRLVLSIQSKRNNNSLVNNSIKINAEKNNNSVIPIQDIFLENSLLKNVNSLFCRSPVLSNTDGQMFSKLFKKKEDFKGSEENM